MGIRDKRDLVESIRFKIYEHSRFNQNNSFHLIDFISTLLDFIESRSEAASPGIKFMTADTGARQGKANLAQNATI